MIRGWRSLFDLCASTETLAALSGSDTMFRCVCAMILFLTLSPALFGQDDDPLRIPANPNWEDLVVGHDAIELAREHPDVPKIRMLTRILLPPVTATRTHVELVYGKHIRVVEPNLKEPGRRHVYEPLDGLRLLVVYKKDKVAESWFVCDGVRTVLVSMRVGEPRYSELVRDLELELRLLSQLLVKTRRLSSIMFPWSRSPARGASTHWLLQRPADNASSRSTTDAGKLQAGLPPQDIELR